VSDYYAIEFASRELHTPKPWPLIVELGDSTFPEIVSGRPDAARLAQFNHPDTPTVASERTVWGWEIDNPTYRRNAIGLSPSYLAIEGGMFALPYIVVVSIEPYLVDAESIEALRAREMEYRQSLSRVAL
jgi:hypothetical protein